MEGIERIARQSFHSSGVTSIAFSPNREFLASGSFDKTIGRVSSEECIKGHTYVVSSVVFSANGEYLASGADMTIGSFVIVFFSNPSFNIKTFCDYHLTLKLQTRKFRDFEKS